MYTEKIRAAVKTYPAFKDEDGCMLRIVCTGHTMDEASGIPVRSHWQLEEHVGGEWRFAASTTLVGYAQHENAKARLV